MALTDDVVRIKYLDAAPTRCIGATVETVAQGVAHQPDDLVARCLAAHEAADHG